MTLRETDREKKKIESRNSQRGRQGAKNVVREGRRLREAGRCASFLLDLYRRALRRAKPLDPRYAPVNLRLGITKEVNLKSYHRKKKINMMDLLAGDKKIRKYNLHNFKNYLNITLIIFKYYFRTYTCVCDCRPNIAQNKLMKTS